LTRCGRKKDFNFYVNENDHSPPHVHIRGKGFEFRINLEDLILMDSVRGLNSKDLKILLGWVAENQDKFLENWERAKKKQKLLWVE